MQFAFPRPASVTPWALVCCALGALGLLRLEQSREPAARPAARWQGLPSVGSAGPRGPIRGHLAWSHATAGRITGRPAVGDDGRVYVTSHDGWLHVLSAEGKPLWRRPLGGPAFGGARLDRAGNVYVGSDAGRLLSFDRNGQPRFAVEAGAPIDTTAVLDPSERQVLCGAGNRLLALQTRSGALLWSFETWGKVFGAPSVDASGVYFGAQDHRVYALTHGGQQRWSYETGGDVDAAPILGPGGVLYVGSDDGALYAIERQSGQLRFRKELGSYLRAPVALPAVASAPVVAVVHGLRPALLALDPRSGRTLGRLQLGLSDSAQRVGRSGPVVDAAGVVYVGLPDHRVVALGAPTRPLWAYVTGGPVHSTPTLGPDGTLYIGSDDGKLYAFRD